MEQTLAVREQKGQSRQFVTFLLGGETYGVSIMKLSEIITYQQPTAIPNVPPFIKGVLNLRGMVIPVIDLRERFHMEPRNHDQFTVIMVVEVAGMTMSMIVDSVSDVVSLDPQEIKPSPHFSGNIRTDFIQGMGIRDKRFIILLDVDRFFSRSELCSIGSLAVS